MVFVWLCWIFSQQEISVIRIWPRFFTSGYLLVVRNRLNAHLCPNAQICPNAQLCPNAQICFQGKTSASCLDKAIILMRVRQDRLQTNLHFPITCRNQNISLKCHPSSTYLTTCWYITASDLKETCGVTVGHPFIFLYCVFFCCIVIVLCFINNVARVFGPFLNSCPSWIYMQYWYHGDM